MRARTHITLLLPLLLVASCDRAATSPAAPHAAPDARRSAPGTPHSTSGLRLTDISAESGIEMVLTSGTMPSTQILEVKGNGLALIDYNNNGFLDLFIPNGATLADTERGPGWRLYENLGEARIRFRDVTAQAGITHTRWALGAAVGDFDHDGWDDLYVTCYGPNVLLRNTGRGSFEDVSERAGVANAGWSTSAAFGDVSGDGALDLYVANYLEFDARRPPPPARFLGTEVLAGPRGLPPQHDALYANNGDGTFADISRASGILDVQPSFGLGVVILDFDDDGRQDIYVGNDSMRNFLFHNRTAPDGSSAPRLVDRGLQSGIGSNTDGGNQATMGIAIADLTGNALPDVFTTNFSSDMNTLHVNAGGLFFDDRTAQYGLGLVSRPYLGWSAGFSDLDLDGVEELLVVNGHVYPQATRELMDSDYEQPPLLFKRRSAESSTPRHDGRFERVEETSVGAWLHEPRRDRAAVFGDLTGNGRIDVVIGEMNGPVRVLRNESETAGGWLIIELSDEREGARNRRGLGSRVELTYTLNHPLTHPAPERQTRWIYGGGFMSAGPPHAHFGLPAQWINDHARFDLRITWPDGHVQNATGVTPNQRARIARE